MAAAGLRAGFAGFWGRQLALVASLAVLGPSAFAAECPGHPDAIGTARTIVVDPTEHPKIGTMQYEETLPLRDHEVVLTFDDGPLPPHSTAVLDILAAQCVKATFFIIGRMAKAFPEGVRRVRDAGHTIGTHSQNHPLSFERMPLNRVKQEIEEGIDSTKAALGNETDLAPFFRIPGLLRSPLVEEYLASRGIMTWSADFPADDWHHIPAARVASLALSRLEAKGKGVLLLHDIQARTVAALPIILRELKARGYRIVHVVPATPDRPKTPTEPREWRYGPSDLSAALRWPKGSRLFAAASATTMVPGLSDLGILDGRGAVIAPTDAMPIGVQRPRIPIPQEPIWPRHIRLAPDLGPTVLAVPSQDLFRIGTVPNDAFMMAQPPRHAAGGQSDQPVMTEASAAPRLLPGASPIPPTHFVRH